MKTRLFDALFHIKRIFCANNSRLIGEIVCFSTLLPLLFCSVLSADVPMSDAELLPGKEVRITAPKTGKTFLVYIPVDYTDKRPFPVIFCYHGYRGHATTWPFKKVGKLGEAFTLYTQIAEILPDTESCRAAKKSAMRLAAKAETELERLKDAFDKKPYAEVTKALTAFRDKYGNSIFAGRATHLLSELLNAKADALEARAVAAETQKNYARALQLYELYLTYFPEAKRYREVQRHVKNLKNKIETQ